MSTEEPKKRRSFNERTLDTLLERREALAKTKEKTELEIKITDSAIESISALVASEKNSTEG